MPTRSPYRIVLLVLGCLLFIYLFVHLNAAAILALLLRIGWYFGLIAVNYAGYELVRAYAYWKCETVKADSSYWDMVRIRIFGEALQFLTFTGPFLAQPAQMWMLRRRGLSGQRAAAATLLEYLICTFTAVALAIFGLIYLLRNFGLPSAVSAPARVTVCVLSAFLLVSAYAIVARVYMIGASIGLIRKIPVIGKHVRLDDNEVRTTEDLLFEVLRERPARFLLILGIEFVAQGLLVMELLIFLRATGMPFTFAGMCAIEGAAKFISLAFFFIPGQAGAAEGTYALIFKAIGLSASAGFALAVVRRLRSLLTAGIGLALASFWKDSAPAGQE